MSEKSRQIGRPEAGELIAGILLNVGKSHSAPLRQVIHKLLL